MARRNVTLAPIAATILLKRWFWGVDEGQLSMFY